MSRLGRSVVLLVALAALGWLGWRAWQPVADNTSALTAATLWTEGAPDGAATTGALFALPNASHAPAAAVRIPDVAFLRRQHPRLARLHLVGDGVDDRAALDGLALTWDRSTPALRAPAIRTLQSPAHLVVGEPFRVNGSIAGIAKGASLTLSLEGPNGATQTTELKGDGSAAMPFALASDATVAPGRFEWKLRVGGDGENVTLGATVTRPELPRVLILQASPSVDAARLQRWLAEAGARVTTRTRVSADHVRFAVANDSRPEFAALEAAVLADFDIAIGTEASLLELSGSERAALEDAVRTTNLGVLVMGEPAATPVGEFFAPWSVAPTPATSEAPRLARLRLADGAALDEPVPVLEGELAARPLARWLARDPQGRTLVAAVPRGGGWVARSLVAESWHWTQAGHAPLFAAFWSSLLRAVARPGHPDGALVENASEPHFVDEPVRLRAGESTGVHRPVQSGWNEIPLSSSVSVALLVQPPDALPELRAERRRELTARAIAAAPDAVNPLSIPDNSRRTGDYVAFAVFVLSAARLWIDQRRGMRPPGS